MEVARAMEAAKVEHPALGREVPGSSPGAPTNQLLSRNPAWLLCEVRDVVRERPVCDEAKGATHGGAFRSENASTSNRNAGESPARRKIKVSCSTVIGAGLVGPKGMAKAGPDGHTVNIP